MVFDEGYFVENGLQSLNMKSTEIMLNVITKLEKGYEKVTKIIMSGGITTIADMEVCKYPNYIPSYIIDVLSYSLPPTLNMAFTIVKS